jgi:hypothetical protein
MPVVARRASRTAGMKTGTLRALGIKAHARFARFARAYAV